MEPLAVLSNQIKRLKQNPNSVPVPDLISTLEKAYSLAHESLTQASCMDKLPALQVKLNESRQEILDKTEELKNIHRKLDSLQQGAAHLQPMFEDLKQKLSGKISLLPFSQDRKQTLLQKISSTSPDNIAALKAEIEDQFKNHFVAQAGEVITGEEKKNFFNPQFFKSKGVS